MPSIQSFKEPTLSQFYSNRKKIVINRANGGLGDIFMHRMLFEDFKLLMPECHLTFACPEKYFDAVSDHPFLDEIIDTKRVKDYNYDTSSACNSYELRKAPYADKHRSDIWAEHCGLNLTKHNMHFVISEEEKNWAKSYLEQLNDKGKKTIAIAPVSAMRSKNLEPSQIQPVIDELKDEYCIFAIHTKELPEYKVDCIVNSNIRFFIALLNEVDYVITVDTSTFHCAGGLGKPMTAVFAWADGKVYGKYFDKMSLVQKHREDDADWTCGPCYKFTSCYKCKETRKPCITEITPKMILDGFEKCLIY